MKKFLSYSGIWVTYVDDETGEITSRRIGYSDSHIKFKCKQYTVDSKGNLVEKEEYNTDEN